MPGVRLLHATARNCVVTIEHPQRPIPSMLCPTCNVRHTLKTYHLWLDDSGGTIVSETVYRRLQECGLPNLAVESEVVKPPTQTIGFNRQTRKLEVVRARPRINQLGI